MCRNLACSRAINIYISWYYFLLLTSSMYDNTKLNLNHATAKTNYKKSSEWLLSARF